MNKFEYEGVEYIVVKEYEYKPRSIKYKFLVCVNKFQSENKNIRNYIIFTLFENGNVRSSFGVRGGLQKAVKALRSEIFILKFGFPYYKVNNFIKELYGEINV